jgi:hypothetical protein
MVTLNAFHVATLCSKTSNHSSIPIWQARLVVRLRPTHCLDSRN